MYSKAIRKMCFYYMHLYTYWSLAKQTIQILLLRLFRTGLSATQKEIVN